MMGPVSLALVLSGGGARGAYEAGVLDFLGEAFPELLAQVRIVTGTSVGAVNGTYLASRGLDRSATRGLVDVWRDLEIDRVIGVSSLDALKFLGAAPLRLLTRSVRSPATGVLDGSGLWKLVTRRVDWEGLQKNLANGRLDAIAVLGTDLASGRTHAFTQTADPRVELPSSGELDFVRVRLARPHVLASAAIPILFPPIRYGGRWYIDGGVRNNTPFSPALRLGARALFVVDVHGVSSEVAPTADFPGIGQVVGKLLDSIFLDRVDFDLDRLRRINDFVLAAEDAGTLDAVLASMAARNRPSYRFVPHVVVKPTVDLGAMAAEHVRDAPGRFTFVRVLDALFQDDAKSSGDAASFLYFDGSFARSLIAAGRRDAENMADEFAALLERLRVSA